MRCHCGRSQACKASPCRIYTICLITTLVVVVCMQLYYVYGKTSSRATKATTATTPSAKKLIQNTFKIEIAVFVVACHS